MEKTFTVKVIENELVKWSTRYRITSTAKNTLSDKEVAVKAVESLLEKMKEEIKKGDLT